MCAELRYRMFCMLLLYFELGNRKFLCTIIFCSDRLQDYEAQNIRVQHLISYLKVLLFFPCLFKFLSVLKIYKSLISLFLIKVLRKVNPVSTKILEYPLLYSILYNNLKQFINYVIFRIHFKVVLNEVHHYQSKSMDEFRLFDHFFKSFIQGFVA